VILLIHCLLPKFSDFGKLHNPVNIRGLLSMRRAVSHAVLIAATLIFMIATSANAADSDATKRLFEAVWANDLGAVRRVVAEGVDPFATDSSGMAPVDVAVDRGYFDIAHYLLAVQNQRIQGAQNLSAPPSPPETTAPVAYAAASTPIAEPTPEPAPEPIIAAAPTVPQLPPMPAPMPAQAPQTIQMGPAPVTDPITEPVIEPAAPIETVEEATQAPEPPIPPQQTEPASVAVSEPPAENQNESSIFQRLSSFMKGESVQESAYSEPVIEPEKVEVEAVTVDPAKEAKPETTSTPAQPQQVVLMSEPTTETVKTDPLVTSNEPDALDRIVGFLRDSTAKLETAPEESQEATKAPEPEPEPVEPVKITEKAEAVSEAPKTTTEPEIPKPKTMSEAVSDAISELVEPPVSATPKPETTSIFDQLADYFSSGSIETTEIAGNIANSAPPASPETVEIIANEAEPVPLRRYLPQQVVSANTTPVEVPEASKVISEPPIEAETPEPPLEPTAVEPRAEALQIAQQKPDIPPAAETTTASASSEPPSEKPAAEPAKVAASPIENTPSLLDQLTSFFTPDEPEQPASPVEITEAEPAPPPAPLAPETAEIIANEAEPVPLRRYLPQQVVSANTTPVEVPEASKIISEPPIEAETLEPSLEPTAVEPRAEALQIAQQAQGIPPAPETTTASASSEPPSEKPAAEPAKVAASPIENTPSLLDQLTSFFTPDEPEQLASPVEITEAEPAPPPAPLAPETAEIIANEAEPVPLRRYLPQQVVSANTTPVEVPEASKIISEPPIEAETPEPSLEPTAVEPRAEALQIAQQAQGIPPASETTTASTSSAPPSEGPAAEPDTVAASPTENTPSLLDQLQGFFTPDEAEQPASPVEITEAEPTPETAVEEIKKQELPVETANVAITKAVPAKTVTSPPAPKIVSSSSVLRASAMTFGDIGHLGKKLEGDRIGGRDCVEKAAWGSYFCIENIDWPETITPSFGPPSYYMGGGRAIVRYDGGQASQYHVLFPSRAFNRMAQYFKNTYGPPSETPEVWTAMLGEPKRYNKTMRWRAPMTDDQGYLIIEIREIDDLRWSSPPDTRHGVARLYREGARTVFELLTTADLLLMQVRQGAYQKDLLAPVDGKSKG